MELRHVETLAIQLMRTHLGARSINGWEFKWNTRITSLGLCDYNKKVIQLSKPWMVKLSDYEIKDTILHEIAHVIAGPLAEHGKDWIAAAKLVGANPIAVANNEEVTTIGRSLATHLLVTPSGTVLKRYYRTPSLETYARVKTMYLPSNKAGTLGTLKIILNHQPLMEL